MNHTIIIQYTRKTVVDKSKQAQDRDIMVAFLDVKG
jgi:hypothetical protein